MSAARDLLEQWPRRFGGGMTAFDVAYFAALRAGERWSVASKAGGMALLEAFVEELERRESEAA